MKKNRKCVQMILFDTKGYFEIGIFLLMTQSLFYVSGAGIFCLAHELGSSHTTFINVTSEL